MCSTHVNRRSISVLLVDVSFQCQLKSMSKSPSKARIKLIKKGTKFALKYNFNASVESQRQWPNASFLQSGISPIVTMSSGILEETFTTSKSLLLIKKLRLRKKFCFVQYIKLVFNCGKNTK